MENEDKKWYAGLGIALTKDLYDITSDKDQDHILSDGIEILSAFTIYPLLKGKKVSFLAAKLIPGTDYLPTHTIAVLWSWRSEKTKQDLEEQDIS